MAVRARHRPRLLAAGGVYVARPACVPPNVAGSTQRGWVSLGPTGPSGYAPGARKLGDSFVAASSSSGVSSTVVRTCIAPDAEAVIAPAAAAA